MAALFLDGIVQVMVVGWGLPTLLHGKGVPTAALLSSLEIATAVQAAATVFGGWLGDRIGRRKLYCIASLALGLGTWFYFRALFRHTTATRLWPMYVANVAYLGLAYGLLQGAFPALLVEIFPEGVRYSGVSFVYHVSRVYSSGVWPYVSRALLAAGRGSSLSYTEAGAATPEEDGPSRGENVVGIAVYTTGIALFSACAVLMIEIYSRSPFQMAHRRSKVRDYVAMPRPRVKAGAGAAGPGDGGGLQQGEEGGGGAPMEGETKSGGGRRGGSSRRRRRLGAGAESDGNDSYDEEAAAAGAGVDSEEDDWSDSYGDEDSDDDEDDDDDEVEDDASFDSEVELQQRQQQRQRQQQQQQAERDGPASSTSSFQSSASHEEEEGGAAAPAAGRPAAAVEI